MTVSLRCGCAFFLEKSAIIKCCLSLPESVARQGEKEPREEPGAPKGEPEADAGEEPASEPEAAAGCPYKSRFEYLRTLSRPEYARHMAEAMKGLKGLSFRDLTQERIWEEWLEGLVDEAGRTIEEG